MKVAEVLSDLTSLRVCEPSAALALVSARPAPPPSSVESVKAKVVALPRDDSQEEDPDLQRAKDLIDLHYKVKVKHAGGAVDEGLEQARRDVREILKSLGMA